MEPVDLRSLWIRGACGACGSVEPVDPRSPGSVEPLILGLDIMIANEHRSLRPILINAIMNAVISRISDCNFDMIAAIEIVSKL